jgi:hypothetical protein
MSQFFDQASLVMVPSGYKNGKVYSQKPLSTDGELTFTRSNDTATRVNSSGLIEKVRTNLLTYSNDFSNAVWSKVRVALTGGQSDPFGGTNAWKMECASSTGSVQIVQNATIGNGSIYAKAGNVSSFNIWVGLNVTFDLSTGTITSGASNGKIESVGNGWYRCTAINSIATVHNPNFTGSSLGDYVYIAFAQGETGDIATDYIATTSAAVSVGPVANLPRLDYSGGATCPSVLLEGQRTNQILQSEAFGSASWAAFNASVSSNISATLDPQGYYGADKLVEDSSSSFHDADQVQTYTAAPYTISVFAKAAGRDHIFLQHFDGVTFFTSGTFNLANGTVSGSGSIEAYSNGWYRCSFTATTVSGTGKAYVNLSNGTTGNYQGDGTSGVYLWGAMLEQGSHSTSYINTLSAAVTRGADECRKGSISSLIGQTEGTLFAEFEVNPLQDSLAIWTRNSATGLYGNMIYLGTNSSNQSRVQVVSGSTVQADIVGSTLTAGFHKFAVAYKNNDFAFYVDGVQIGTASSGTIPTGMNELYIDQYIDGGIRNASKKQVLLFKTRLTNAQLAELTTL